MCSCPWEKYVMATPPEIDISDPEHMKADQGKDGPAHK